MSLNSLPKTTLTTDVTTDVQRPKKETADEDIRDVFGMSITLVSKAKSKKEGKAFFELLGIPFKKEEKK